MNKRIKILTERIMSTSKKLFAHTVEILERYIIYSYNIVCTRHTRLIYGIVSML